MSKVFIETDSLTAIGDAIRAKGGTSDALSVPTGMVTAINNIETKSSLTKDDYNQLLSQICIQSLSIVCPINTSTTSTINLPCYGTGNTIQVKYEIWKYSDLLESDSLELWVADSDSVVHMSTIAENVSSTTREVKSFTYEDTADNTAVQLYIHTTGNGKAASTDKLVISIHGIKML